MDSSIVFYLSHMHVKELRESECERERERDRNKEWRTGGWTPCLSSLFPVTGARDVDCLVLVPGMQTELPVICGWRVDFHAGRERERDENSSWRVDFRNPMLLPW